MSISAAIAELNKEIEAVGKAITESQKTQIRLVAHRDAFLEEKQVKSNTAVSQKGKSGRKPGRPSKKAASAKKTVASKRRRLSPKARKRIADAQRKRWVAQQAAAKSA